MKKKYVVCLVAMFVLSLLSGCGSSDISSYKPKNYVELGEYLNLSVTVDAKKEVTDEEVENQVFGFYLSRITPENGYVVDRAVENGDTVIIDYVGKKDGVAFQGGSAQDSDLAIGSGQFIDGFEEGLIGVKPGETVDLNLTFPEKYPNAELAGAKVVFTVTVDYIMPTEMEDDVVAGFGFDEFKTVEELKNFYKEYLEEEAEAAYRESLMQAFYDTVIANSTFKKFPAKLLEQVKEDIKADLTSIAANYGVDAATYVSRIYNSDYDSFVEKNAEFSIKMDFITYAIMDKENLLQDEEELEQKMEQFALDKGWESLDQLLEKFDKEEIKKNMRQEGVLDFLIENGKITHR